MNVGFIGIGSMGAAIVPRLMAADHYVGAWNRNAVAVAKIDGVTVVASTADAFRNDVVLTLLADDKAVRIVIVDSGVLASARKDCVHVMLATISLALVNELVALHRNAGIAYVAVPVFGVPAAAAQRQLNILAAGDTRDISAVQPLFDVMGQKTWPLGDDPVRANVGSSQKTDRKVR